MAGPPAEARLFFHHELARFCYGLPLPAPASRGRGSERLIMTYDGADFIRKMHAGCCTRLAKQTVALYIEHEKKIIQNGTGVLFRVADRSFIVSAAHVFDPTIHHRAPLFVGLPHAGVAPMSLAGSTIIASAPTPGSNPPDRDEDPYDVAVVLLPENVVDSLKEGFEFATMADVDLDDDDHIGSYYLLMGYPNMLSHAGAQNDTGHSELFPYGTITYRDSGAQPRNGQEFLLEWGRSATSGDDGKIIALPNPRGISGCGVWRLRRPPVGPAEWSPDHARLVGIEHTWRKDECMVRCTRFRVVVELLYRELDDLRRPLSLSCPRTVPLPHAVRLEVPVVDS